jgi:hypothetical protein
METESLSTLCRQENDSRRFSFHLYFGLFSLILARQMWLDRTDIIVVLSETETLHKSLTNSDTKQA